LKLIINQGERSSKGTWDDDWRGKGGLERGAEREGKGDQAEKLREGLRRGGAHELGRREKMGVGEVKETLEELVEGRRRQRHHGGCAQTVDEEQA
jgi:hypothetical protein